MKSFASVALLSAALIAAAPVHEKRDIVWHTTWTEVTETEWATTTTWVAAGSEVSAAAANPGGDFHESAVHYTHAAEHTSAWKKPSQLPLPSYSKPTSTPAPTPAPVPTTSSSEAPAPAPPAPTMSSSEAPAPAPPAPTITSIPTSTYIAPAPETPTTTYVAPPPPETPTTTSTPVYVAPIPSTTSVYVAPAPTSTYVAPPPPETTSAAAAPTPSPYSSGSGSSSGSSSGASFTGVQLTFYTPGMGSCGIESSASDAIVALDEKTMQLTNPGNPNNNPMCGKKISITANGVTKTATIVDTCPGCVNAHDLDLSPSLFDAFAAEAVGRIYNAEWSFID